MFVQQLFVFFSFVLQIKFSQVPFSTLILGEMTWSHMICSPKFSDLISYAIYTARGGTWIKTKQCFVLCLGLFLVTVVYILKKIT